MDQKTRDTIQKMMDQLECFRDEEQEKYDNAPEGIQATERFERIQGNADNLDEALEYLREIVDF